MPEAGFAEVIAHLAKNYLAREDRKLIGRKHAEHKDSDRSTDNASLSRCGGDNKRAANNQSAARFTPRTRRRILARDKACTYKDPRTGKICGSTYQLQVDHIYPKALGGSDEPENLRSLCRKHNLLMAEKMLGPWVKRYRTSG